MINCTGVLHHMQDVAAGLAGLVPLLLPRGLMKVALYSRIAREPLMRAREDIRAAGFGPAVGDIRRFRRQVLDAGPRMERMPSSWDPRTSTAPANAGICSSTCRSCS